MCPQHKTTHPPLKYYILFHPTCITYLAPEAHHPTL